MKPKRYGGFYMLFVIMIVIIVLRLVNLQVTQGAYYREKSNARTLRSVELVAPRGEILDRNGRAIVSNKSGFNIYILSIDGRTSQQLNRVISNLFIAVSDAAVRVEGVLPIIEQNGKFEFSTEDKVARTWKKNCGFSENDSAQAVVKSLCEKYSISTKDYSNLQVLQIAATRLNMKKLGFSAASPYLFAEDVTVEEISVIKEQSESFSGVSIVTQPVRNYPYKSLGAHMLGRVGVINSDEYQENKNNGYTINSNIGKDGIEKLLEDYLRGENGRGSIEQNAQGHSMGQSIAKAPVNGRNVNLTIDIDMQIACEKALRDTVLGINAASGSAEGGRDADAGSIVVIDVNTGEILAMASYPTYEIANFNENYNELVQNPSKPLFNRALSGTYSPASTFKLLVGAAALEEGIITPDEEIFDTGKYTFFSDYQPGCWIYNQTGATHGYLNVSEAIRDSCNVFFFDVGRRLSIEKMNEYAKKFGLGEKSGIELSAEEKAGIVANPDNRKSNGGVWYPGDVCQTAIGQSDTLVTPIQLANYIATIANGGTRYRPHIIKSIQNSDGTVSKEFHPEILSRIDMSDENRQAIVSGLRMVVTEGTARNAFAGCKVSVAAKTGSAQTSGVYTNGVCVAYAPYENPRVAIACVIEKAGSGANVAQAVRKVVDSYFENAEDSDLQTGVLTK